jgi:hypothetical protein
MKTRILLIIGLATVICMSFVGFTRSDGTVISISPSSSTLPQSQIGNSFQININISDVANLWFWKVRLNWNPSVLNFTKIGEGPFLKSAGYSTLFPPPPQRSGCLTEISDGIMANASVSGSGVLATITFQVLAAGQSGITLNETVLLQPQSGHPQIANTVSNGQLIVLSEFPSWIPLAITLAAAIPAAILAKKRLKPTRAPSIDHRTTRCKMSQ